MACFSITLSRNLDNLTALLDPGASDLGSWVFCGGNGANQGVWGRNEGRERDKETGRGEGVCGYEGRIGEGRGIREGTYEKGVLEGSRKRVRWTCNGRMGRGKAPPGLGERHDRRTKEGGNEKGMVR